LIVVASAYELLSFLLTGTEDGRIVPNGIGARSAGLSGTRFRSAERLELASRYT
jgi:hypothetical protein